MQELFIVIFDKKTTVNFFRIKCYKPCKVQLGIRREICYLLQNQQKIFNFYTLSRCKPFPVQKKQFVPLTRFGTEITLSTRKTANL